MSQISVSSLTFCYEGSYDNIFENVSFAIDTDWKLGFVGRNGRGKTTFLKLLMGEYDYRGSIASSVEFDYFPFDVAEPDALAMDCVASVCPDAEEWEILREINRLNVDAGALYRPFNTLSHGERTKLMLAGMFLRRNSFLLIDEPTNHLDAEGRAQVAEYLNGKKGFILVSHDRAFMDNMVDRVAEIDRGQVTLYKGNSSAYLKAREERIERLRSRAKAAAEPVADIDGLRAENARLRADAEAWEEIATDQERSYSDATAKVDELTRTVQRLEGEKRALERKAAQCAAPSDDDGAARVAECLQSIPRDLTDLLKLARSIWPERIVVLPEAMDSAKSYDGNLAEEWDIVRSTATALYGLLFEDDGCEGQVADEFQRRTGYELTFSESSATRARADLMKMRERSYGGRTVDISAHIKGRSQKNTFRLHFYIDRENELIVIGHAGCHMKTAGSHRRGFK